MPRSPGAAAAVDVSVDADDVQGLLRFGFKHHTEAAFVLLRLADRAAARAWLASADVATAAVAAAQADVPSTVLQLALSAEGLRALGVPGDIVAGFAPEFVAGLGTDPNRARRLGDIGANDPSHWAWGGPANDRAPHVVALIYALPGKLAAFRSALEQAWRGAFDIVRTLDTADMDGVEPFGFADGISQPEPDWTRSRVVEDRDLLTYGNLTCLGEFVLGYPNEYGRYTERPLIDVSPATAALPRAEDDPSRADLGRNGSYLVLRTLSQDVPAFWRFIDAQAKGDEHERVRLAEAMVGRRMDGSPLVEAAPTRPSTDMSTSTSATMPAPTPAPEPIADKRTRGSGNGSAINDFTFMSDRDGLRCPLGAHIRRSNPRNADLPPGADDLIGRVSRILGFDAAGLESDRIASTRFHRLLRRGREYGAALSIDQALSKAMPTPTPETGLHFMCLCADLARQFEFVQGAWLMGTKFAGLPHEADPLLGHRQPVAGDQASDIYSMPRAGGPCSQMTGLPRFVTVVGGAYFFLPGVRALRWLASTPAAA